MKKAFQKIFSLFKKTDPMRKWNARRSKGQSFVEFALLLPVLITLFTGLVEFGFMLNTYLSLIDATRQSARLCSNKTPFKQAPIPTDPVVDDLTFSPYCAQVVVDTLAPPSDPNARQIVLDTDRDDVTISVLRVSVDNTDPASPTISTIERFPVGPLFYSYSYNISGYHYESLYTDTVIENLMTQNGTPPVESGILIVEVDYGYTGTLKLPWFSMFMSDGNPVMLHASTMMPLVAAKP